MTAKITEEPLYRVPHRFGMAPILMSMLMLAVTFVFLRALNTHPWYHLTISLFFFAVCGAQMWVNREPRAVSAISGAVFLPLWLIISASLFPLEDNYVPGLVAAAPLVAVLGAFCGYLLGALGAGVFLVLDQIHKSRHHPLELDDEDEMFRMEGPLESKRKPHTAVPEPSGVSDAPREAALGDQLVARAVGPPESIPVFNCQLLVSRENNGVYRARSPMLDGIDILAPTEREALQGAVKVFKQKVQDYHSRGEPIAWLDPPREKREGESERWIAVHL